MALLWSDGFDWVSTALNADATNNTLMQTKAQQRVVSSSGPLPQNYVVGRGGRGGALQWDNTQSYYQCPNVHSPGDDSPIIFGFAYKPKSSFVNNNTFLYLLSSVRTQCSLRYFTSNNTIGLYRNTTNFLEASPENLLDLDVWQYIEFKIHVSDTAGYLVMRKNGKVVWETATNLNNLSQLGSWSSFRLDPCRLGNDCELDDLYICDDNGPTNNDFLGDVAIETLRPNADGDFTSWSKSGAGDHYEQIDKVPYTAIPDDSSYVETNVVDETELFEFENLPSTINKSTRIYGVAAFPMLRCTDGTNPPRMVNVARRKNKESENAGNINNWLRTDLFAADAKQRIRHEDDWYAQGRIFETEPRNGEEWTVEDVNDAQFGARYLG